MVAIDQCIKETLHSVIALGRHYQIMKILRISRIRNHRIFRDFSWPASLPNFSQFNVIYGWNGVGKTTFSNLFRHIQIKRNIEEGEIHYLIDQQIVHQSDLVSAALPQVRVFNRDSVDRSVFEVAGKHFSAIYFLGENSVEKQKQIQGLKKAEEKALQEHITWSRTKTSAEREWESFCTAEARAIKNLLTSVGGGRYNNYDSRLFKQAVRDISSASQPIPVFTEEKIAELRVAKDAKFKEKLQCIDATLLDFHTHTSDVTSLLHHSVVSNVIEDLTNAPVLASWLNHGIELHRGEHATELCRFCEQSLPMERLVRLEAHFNDEFKRFQNEIESQILRLQTAREKVELLIPPDKGLLYDHLVPQYKTAVSTLTQQKLSVRIYFDALLEALHAKKDKPFEVIELESFLGFLREKKDDAGWLLKVLDVIRSGAIRLGATSGQNAAKQINALIEQHNKHTENFQQAVQAARSALEQASVVSSLKRYNELQTAVGDADTKSLSASQKSVEIREQIAELERAIREHQRPADELNTEMQSYLGRSELQFEVRDTGYAITRNGQPALNLSEGERTAIAFMYFLKTLEDTGFDIKTGIVVIDDPVSSLDANSLYSAFGIMKARTKEVGQLFILTHNFTFFRQVRNWFYKLPNQKKDIAVQPARFYMLSSKNENGQRSTSLEPLDTLLHRYESEYHYLFKRIYEEAYRLDASQTMEANYGMPNIARRVLESFLAFRLPGNPGALHQQLEQVSYDVAKKTRILRFLHTHSHYGQIAEPEHDCSVLSETQPVLQDLLELIQNTDPIHYAGMEALMEPRSVANNVAPLNSTIMVA